MKKLILIVLGTIGMSFSATPGWCQSNTLIGLYGGAGITPRYNYDIGISGGIDFQKGIGKNTNLGGTLFYQSFAFLYDNEPYAAKNGTGNAGFTVLNKSSYIFIAPKLSHDFGRKQGLQFYVDAGAGFKMSGTETTRKWDDSHGSAYGNYDSTINTSANLNSLLIRLGVGLTEYIQLNGSKWRFSITEDGGFLANSLSKTGDANNESPSRTSYSPNKLSPAYFSLQIGITHNSIKR